MNCDSSITITKAAADKIKEAMIEEDFDESFYLIISVLGGGCAGLQYSLDFSNDVIVDDCFISNQFGIPIAVDCFSASHLSGTNIDYVDEIQGSGFKFNNPTASRSCGCGNSFQ